MEESKVIHENLQPVKIEVERGQRGGYGWTISVRGNDFEAMWEQIRAMDTRMKAEYGVSDSS